MLIITFPDDKWCNNSISIRRVKWYYAKNIFHLKEAHVCCSPLGFLNCIDWLQKRKCTRRMWHTCNPNTRMDETTEVFQGQGNWSYRARACLKKRLNQWESNYSFYHHYNVFITKGILVECFWYFLQANVHMKYK